MRGIDMSDTPEERLKHKEANLFAEITRLLPDFAKSCRENKDTIIIHQDSFAADYQDEDLMLMMLSSLILSELCTFGSAIHFRMQSLGGIVCAQPEDHLKAFSLDRFRNRVL
jgi:hypothetical protein